MVWYCIVPTRYACGCQSCVDESEGVRKKKAEGGKDLPEKGRWIELEVVNWRLEVAKQANVWWSDREDERVELRRWR